MTTVSDTKSTPVDVVGRYNEMPQNWSEITESEFFWRWGISPASMHTTQVHKQVRLSEGEALRNVTCFVHPDGGGIGWICIYDGRATRSEIDAFKPVYFKWYSCEHDFETTKTSRCYWEGRCTKCGWEIYVDSSD